MLAYERGFNKGEESVLKMKEKEAAKGRPVVGTDFNDEYYNRKPYKHLTLRRDTPPRSPGARKARP